MANKWISLGSLMIGVIGLTYGVYKDFQGKRLREVIQEKNNRLEANSMYGEVRTKREIFEDKLAELIILNESAISSEKQRLLLQAYNKYSSLYNEIEDFCTKINDGAIDSESYILETILPILNELAELQVETFKTLIDYENKHNLKEIKQPDYKAFDKYDKFLIKYNGGETSHFWKKLKNSRRDNGFE